MSELAIQNVKIPAHLAARVGQPSALAASVSGGLSSGDGGPRISIKGSRFRIVDGDTEVVLETLSLDTIIVGANPHVSKIWFEKKWTPDSDPSEPDCYSMDGIRPDPGAHNPQSETCATCQWNEWGSRISEQGKEIKACADQKRLAVVAADDADGPVYLLQVTPAALKGLNQYQKQLASRGIPPEIVKTRVAFDPDASFPKLMFTFGGFLDAETQEVVDGLFGSPEVKQITGEARIEELAVMQAAADEAPKTSAVQRAAAKKRVEKVVEQAQEDAEEQVEEQVEEQAEEPVVRGFGRAATGTAKKVAKKQPTVVARDDEAEAEAEAPKTKRKPAAKSAAKSAKADTSADDAASLADEIAQLVGFDDD